MVLVDVELKPARTRCLRKNRLHCGVRERTENEQGPRRLGRVCRRNLARRAGEFLKRRWRSPSWHGDRLTQHCGAQLAWPYSGEDVIVKLQPFPTRCVL